jgi:hypothetical protein
MSMHGTLRTLCGGAVLLALAPGTPQAAPVGGRPAALATEARMATPVEQVASRRCYWRGGVRVCRPSAQRPYAYRAESNLGFTYGNPRPESLPPGSTAWWEAMERWGRTGGRIR